MCAGPALQRETSNTCESITCHVLQGLASSAAWTEANAAEKNIHLVIRAADIVSVDISCNDAYFNCNVIPPASFPQSLIGNTS